MEREERWRLRGWSWELSQAGKGRAGSESCSCRARRHFPPDGKQAAKSRDFPAGGAPSPCPHAELLGTAAPRDTREEEQRFSIKEQQNARSERCSGCGSFSPQRLPPRAGLFQPHPIPPARGRSIPSPGRAGKRLFLAGELQVMLRQPGRAQQSHPRINPRKGTRCGSWKTSHSNTHSHMFAADLAGFSQGQHLREILSEEILTVLSPGGAGHSSCSGGTGKGFGHAEQLISKSSTETLLALLKDFTLVESWNSLSWKGPTRSESKPWPCTAPKFPPCA